MVETDFEAVERVRRKLLTSTFTQKELNSTFFQVMEDLHRWEPIDLFLSHWFGWPQWVIWRPLYRCNWMANNREWRISARASQPPFSRVFVQQSVELGAIQSRAIHKIFVWKMEHCRRREIRRIEESWSVGIAVSRREDRRWHWRWQRRVSTLYRWK